jgi:hypothetical protein
MQAARALLLSLSVLAALGSAVSCRSKQPPGAASARPSAAPPPKPAATASVARRNQSGCRVLGVTGTPTGATENLDAGRLFRAGEWLDLGAGTDVSFRHTETAREFSLGGPGRFQPCEAGAEKVSIARGTLLTTAGPGARAGAEVLLATPFALIRYADAKLALTVEERKLMLEVAQGSATVEPVARGGKAEPEKTVTGPNGTLTLDGTSDAEALVTACNEARGAIASGAPRPAGIASGGSRLGNWAVNQLKVRRTARFVCAAADAALGRLTGPELSRLSGLLEATEAAEKHPSGPPGK